MFKISLSKFICFFEHGTLFQLLQSTQLYKWGDFSHLCCSDFSDFSDFSWRSSTGLEETFWGGYRKKLSKLTNTSKSVICCSCFLIVCILLFWGGAIEMIATTGTVTVHRHGNSLSYNMLGCVSLLIGTFLSVSITSHCINVLYDFGKRFQITHLYLVLPYEGKWDN